jgi:hypothetical protein
MKTLRVKRDLQRCDLGFVETVRNKYPDKSFSQATKELNKVLWTMLYGKK